MRFVDFKLHDSRVFSVDADKVTALLGQGDSTIVFAAGLTQSVVGSLEEVKQILSPSKVIEGVTYPQVESTEVTTKTKGKK